MNHQKTFWIRDCSPRCLIPTAQSVGRLLHPHPDPSSAGFLVWLNWEVCAEKEILMCPCPSLGARCPALPHPTLLSPVKHSLRAGTGSQQALSSPCSKIYLHLHPLINVFYQAYNNTAHQKSPIPRSCTFDLFNQEANIFSPTKRLLSKEDSDLLPGRLNINHVSCNQYSWRNTTSNNRSIFPP